MSVPVAELKDRLRKALQVRDMKPIELSEKTKIPKSAISQYMSGYTNPKQDRIHLICKALNINEAWLLGYDAPFERTVSEPELTAKDEKDIAKRLEAALEDLENQQEALMFSGEPLDDHTRELLKASLENSIRIAKINAKEKYTPKKYKKD